MVPVPATAGFSHYIQRKLELLRAAGPSPKAPFLNLVPFGARANGTRLRRITRRRRRARCWTQCLLPQVLVTTSSGSWNGSGPLARRRRLSSLTECHSVEHPVEHLA